MVDAKGDLTVFTRFGEFVRDGDAVRLSLHQPLPKGWAVYAFRQNGEWKYVGSAREMASRMRSYFRHQNKASESRVVHVELRAALACGPVEVHGLATDPVIGDINGMPVHLALGIEAGLIYKLSPVWNRRGLDKTASLEKLTGSDAGGEPEPVLSSQGAGV